jgi:hypothetical protein
MSHICANDEYRFQVGVTNRPENIVIPYVIVISLSLSSISFCEVIDVFSFHLPTDFSLAYRSAFAQIFPRSQSMKKSNTSTSIYYYCCYCYYYYYYISLFLSTSADRSRFIYYDHYQ